MAEETKRVMPQSELDFHLMTTDAVWGSNQVSIGLQEALKKYVLKRDEKHEPLRDAEGNLIGHEASDWETLGFYTRDMRLSNLSVWNGELAYCQYHLDLANDLLQSGMREAFLIALSRVATLLELGQSKGGFLRRQMNTLRQEHMQGQMEPPKKQLFGKNNKQNDYGGGY